MINIKKDNPLRRVNDKKQINVSKSNSTITNKNKRNNLEKKYLIQIISTVYQESELRNNISSISIIVKRKNPKKEYVLNVRKTDVIQTKNKIRMVYNNYPNC